MTDEPATNLSNAAADLEVKVEKRKGKRAMEYGCKASVTITLRVKSKGHWGGDATVAEVQRMGGQETINGVINALRVGQCDFEIVGVPKVGAVTWGPIDED